MLSSSGMHTPEVLAGLTAHKDKIVEFLKLTSLTGDNVTSILTRVGPKFTEAITALLTDNSISTLKSLIGENRFSGK